MEGQLSTAEDLCLWNIYELGENELFNCIILKLSDIIEIPKPIVRWDHAAYQQQPVIMAKRKQIVSLNRKKKRPSYIVSVSMDRIR